MNPKKIIIYILHEIEWIIGRNLMQQSRKSEKKFIFLITEQWTINDIRFVSDSMKIKDYWEFVFN